MKRKLIGAMGEVVLVVEEGFMKQIKQIKK